MPEKFLMMADVLNLTSLSKTEIYRRIRQGKFPDRVRLGPQRVAWKLSDITAWQEDLEKGAKHA